MKKNDSLTTLEDEIQTMTSVTLDRASLLYQNAAPTISTPVKQVTALYFVQ